MSKKLDVIGVGYPSLDYIIPLNEEPSNGKTSLIISDNSEVPYYGGCVVNIIYLLNHFNYHCGLTMTVGKDFEKSGFKRFLMDKKVNLDYVTINTDYNTSFTKLLMSPNGEHTTLFYPGAVTSDLYQEKNLTQLDTRYGLLAIGETQENESFLDECIEQNIPTIFSMKGDYHSLKKDYLIKVIKNSELIFMNEAEFFQLKKYLSRSLFDYLKDDPNKILIVTLGSRGSLVFSNGEDSFVPAYDRAEVVDTSGGGDAFIAGFLSEYFKKASLTEAAVMGTVLASFIIEDYGCLTNIPNKKDIEIRKKYIKERLNNGKADALLRAYRR